MARRFSYYDKLKETIVFTNGCFDMFHVGHLHILKEAKKHGSKLIVGVNSDDSVKRLKGKYRPVINENDRLNIVSSIECVDQVILFDEDTPLKLIEKIKPDVIVKGGDYEAGEVVGSNMARVVIVPLIPNISTSDIILKIKLMGK